MLVLNTQALLSDFNSSREIWSLGSETFRNELNALNILNVLTMFQVPMLLDANKQHSGTHAAPKMESQWDPE